MSREFDRRDFTVNKATAKRVRALTARAKEVSKSLAGTHRIRIVSVDPGTGNPAGIVSDSPPAEAGNYIQRALDHVQTIGPALGLAPGQPNEFSADPHVQSTSSGAAAVYLQQEYKSVSIFQAAQTVRFTPAGLLAETAGTTVTVDHEVEVAPKLSVEQAVLKAAAFVAEPQPDERDATDQFGEHLEAPAVDLTGWTPKVIATFSNKADAPTVLAAGPFGDVIKALLMWFSVAEGLRLVWQILLPLPGYAGVYRVMVDAETGEILYSHQLMQTVVAAGNVYQADGAAGRTMTPFPRPLSDYGLPVPAQLPSGFPNDWIIRDSTVGHYTNAHLEDMGSASQGVVKNGVLTFDPADPQSDDQKVLNIFYYTCYMHDFFYLLGFRETDGNFEQDDLGHGDAVDARAYRGAVWATASMNTPVDGSAPVMKMGLVTSTQRHTAFDATVVFHEFTHGVTNRLIGGVMNDHALDAQQSSGMGEGWSDYLACTVTGSKVIAAWVVNQPGGVRAFPYDDNYPDNFGKLGQGRYTEPHNIGELWAAPLLAMNRTIGATLGLQLVVDALKLMPANPSFLDARDAILTALDNMQTAGRIPASQHDTALRAVWGVFARFGMGAGAQCNGPSLQGIVADFNVPPDVGAPPPPPPPPVWQARSRIGTTSDRAPVRSAVTVAMPHADRLDLFVVESDGGIYTTARQGSAGAWAAWARVGGASDRMPLRSVVTPASPQADRLDLFVVAADGAVYTTAREGAGPWADWAQVGTALPATPLGSIVTAVVPQAGRLDLFVVAGNGGIYTAAREGSAGTWAGWTRVGTAADQVPPGSVVTATVPHADRVDLFVVANDGGVYTTAREGSTGAWTGWARVGTAANRAAPGTVVAAVVSHADRVDLCVVASDGGIYTTAREGSAGAWSGWARVGAAADQVPLSSVVTAAMPHADRLDLFVVAGDGGIYTSAREGSAGAWAGWARVGAAADQAPLGSVVAAAAPHADRLDLFVVAADGGIYTTARGT